MDTAAMVELLTDVHQAEHEPATATSLTPHFDERVTDREFKAAGDEIRAKEDLAGGRCRRSVPRR
jgi:hypothetical protein